MNAVLQPQLSLDFHLEISLPWSEQRVVLGVPFGYNNDIINEKYNVRVKRA